MLIGNGFDLAHGLKTKFSDFIEFYWNSIKFDTHEDDFIKMSGFEMPLKFSECKNFEHFKSQMTRLTRETRDYVNQKYTWGDGWSLKFKNTFFELLNNQKEPLWVDVEMAYYKELKKILKFRLANFSDEEAEEYQVEKVNHLNSEIYDFTRAFNAYLSSEVKPKITSGTDFVIPHFHDYFNNISLQSNEDQEHFLREFSPEYKNRFKLRPGGIVLKHTLHNGPRFNDSMTLNFNFTNTPALYAGGNLEIKIHGSIYNDSYPVLLGFGDEMDAFYAEIENLNRSEYLQFMKSSHYTQNENYKHLFDFLNEEEFQIQIMGHSCGLSDRTLLSSIFQHPNCMSIKIYYYEYSTPNKFGELDNYSEIFRSLSRHFTDKIKMRERVVNKKYCNPLPQHDWLK